MKNTLLFCALCALLGCRTVVEPSGEVIALSYSTLEQSKTDLLTEGDEIGVFSNIEGTENYFLENAKYIVGSDGRSLSTTPAVYYPDPKQAVRFLACFPYHSGVFSVPSDQSTALALKQADLCWAAASTTPVATPVPLQFEHKLARLLITTNTPTEKITIPNAFSGGTLDVRTGVFTNTTKSTITTTGTELIFPTQTLSRLILTVAGVEYVFEGSITLLEAKTTTANLTLNPSTKTATLSGSSTTNWIGSASQGNPTQAVSNVLTIHWPNYVPQGTTPEKVVFTINSVDYTVSSKITYADKTFTVPFASSTLRYPYTITKIAFNNIPLACTQLLGATIYKSATSTLGIKDVPNAVLINGLWWATGNLVANGVNGCKIGTPIDCGLYFQFGSLIGWSGGGAPNYDGSGAPSSVVASIKIRPIEYIGGTTWTTAGRFTVAGTTGLSTNFNKQPGGANDPKTGVGDPCSYYLGVVWRTATMMEFNTLFDYTGYGCALPRNGWAYNSSYNAHYHSASGLRFVSAGRRDDTGKICYIGQNHDYQTCSVGGPTNGWVWNTDHSLLYNVSYLRQQGHTVRCVGEAN